MKLTGLLVGRLFCLLQLTFSFRIKEHNRVLDNPRKKIIDNFVAEISLDNYYYKIKFRNTKYVGYNTFLIMKFNFSFEPYSIKNKTFRTLETC